MRLVFLYVVSNLVSLAAVAGAVFLAYEGKDGWGWMVVLALLSHTTIKGA